VEFSSPVKLREPFQRRVSSPSEQDDSPRPARNGIKSSLGDLQGVDLLRGFEKISPWREGGSSSPIKDHEIVKEHEMRGGQYDEKWFGRELNGAGTLREQERERVNGNGNGTREMEVDGMGEGGGGVDGDSKMTDVKVDESGR